MKKKKQSAGSDRIEKVLKLGKFRFVKEHKFLKDRRFKFDFAIPSHKIAIEYEGGVWIGGRHTSGKGYVRDVEKYRLALLDGWKVLRYTSEDLKNNKEFEIIDHVKILMEQWTTL